MLFNASVINKGNPQEDYPSILHALFLMIDSSTILSLFIVLLVFLFHILMNKKIQSKFAHYSHLELQNKTLLEAQAKNFQQVIGISNGINDVITQTEQEIAKWAEFEDWQRYSQNINHQCNALRGLSRKLLYCDLSNSNVTNSNARFESTPISTNQIVEDILRPLARHSSAAGKQIKCLNHSDAIVNLPERLLERMIQKLISFVITRASSEHSIVVTASSENNWFCLTFEYYGEGICNTRETEIKRHISLSPIINNVHNILNGVDTLSLEDLAVLVCNYSGRFEIQSALSFITRLRIGFPVVGQEVMQNYSKLPNCIDTETVIDDLPSISLPRLLILSENNESAFNLKNELQAHFDCEFCFDLETAIEMYARLKPNLMLIEHNFENINGFHAYQVLRNLQIFSKALPSTVFMSPYNDKVSTLKMLRHGISAVVNAPYILKEIRLILVNLLKENPDVFGVNEKTSVYLDSKELSQQMFLNKFDQLLENHYRDPSFNKGHAALALHMDKRTLSRKLSVFSNLGFSERLRKFRLNKSRDLVLQGLKISVVCYQVGFSNLSHFSTAFKREFGTSPSKLLEISHGHL